MLKSRRVVPGRLLEAGFEFEVYGVGGGGSGVGGEMAGSAAGLEEATAIDTVE